MGSTRTDGSVAVCVCSYLRPEGLQRLLWAIAQCEFEAAPPRVEVIVVDNDAARSAEAVCHALRDSLPFELHYAVEKRRGISQARNAALALALPCTEFVAITDDDVEPTPGWLAELLRVQRLSGADVVAGPNRARFLRPPPQWISDGGFFEGPRNATGTSLRSAATHNVLVRCETLAAMDSWFDERLGDRGGEDTEFFLRMAAGGAQMVWADDALVYECVPESRATFRWLMQRAFRIANGMGSAHCRHLRGMTRLDVLREGSRCLARGCFQLVAHWRQGTVARARAARLIVSGAGWLSALIGLRYREYRKHHGE
jgi:glycosyltransferase involved in cell wall biosynthesis